MAKKKHVRAQRKLQQKFTVYCEGDTEENYLKGLRAWFPKNYPEIQLAIETIPIGGGGYSEFVKAVESAPDSNCLARFVLLDYDRCQQYESERKVLQKLINLSKASIKKRVPVIIILSNGSFEYPLCCHDPRYSNGDEARFLHDVWGYKDLSDVKGDDKIWDVAHRDGRGHDVAIEKLARRPKLMVNRFTRQHAGLSINLTDVKLDQDNEAGRSSNLPDLFKAMGVSS